MKTIFKFLMALFLLLPIIGRAEIDYQFKSKLFFKHDITIVKDQAEGYSLQENANIKLLIVILEKDFFNESKKYSDQELEKKFLESEQLADGLNGQTNRQILSLKTIKSNDTTVFNLKYSYEKNEIKWFEDKTYVVNKSTTAIANLSYPQDTPDAIKNELDSGIRSFQLINNDGPKKSVFNVFKNQYEKFVSFYQNKVDRITHFFISPAYAEDSSSACKNFQKPYKLKGKFTATTNSPLFDLGKLVKDIKDETILVSNTKLDDTKLNCLSNFYKQGKENAVQYWSEKAVNEGCIENGDLITTPNKKCSDSTLKAMKKSFDYINNTDKDLKNFVSGESKETFSLLCSTSKKDTNDEELGLFKKLNANVQQSFCCSAGNGTPDTEGPLFKVLKEEDPHFIEFNPQIRAELCLKKTGEDDGRSFLSGEGAGDCIMNALQGIGKIIKDTIHMAGSLFDGSLITALAKFVWDLPDSANKVVETIGEHIASQVYSITNCMSPYEKKQYICKMVPSVVSMIFGPGMATKFVSAIGQKASKSAMAAIISEAASKSKILQSAKKIAQSAGSKVGNVAGKITQTRMVKPAVAALSKIGKILGPDISTPIKKAVLAKAKKSLDAVKTTVKKTETEARQIVSKGGPEATTVMSDEAALLAERRAAKVEANADTLATNSKLTDAERKVAAEEAIGRPLNEAQQQAVIDAHEIAKEGEGIGSYSAETIRQKTEALKAAGFSAEERRALMDQGITGQYATQNISPASVIKKGDGLIMEIRDPHGNPRSVMAEVSDVTPGGEVKISYHDPDTGKIVPVQNAISRQELSQYNPTAFPKDKKDIVFDKTPRDSTELSIQPGTQELKPLPNVAAAQDAIIPTPTGIHPATSNTPLFDNIPSAKAQVKAESEARKQAILSANEEKRMAEEARLAEDARIAEEARAAGIKAAQETKAASEAKLEAEKLARQKWRQNPATTKEPSSTSIVHNKDEPIPSVTASEVSLADYQAAASQAIGPHITLAPKEIPMTSKPVSSNHATSSGVEVHEYQGPHTAAADKHLARKATQDGKLAKNSAELPATHPIDELKSRYDFYKSIKDPKLNPEQIKVNKKGMQEVASKFNDADRTEAASLLIERELTTAQKKALVEAHNTKLPNEGFGNYSQATMNRKGHILEQAGFSKTERRTLMETGLAGEEAPLELALAPGWEKPIVKNAPDTANSRASGRTYIDQLPTTISGEINGVTIGVEAKLPPAKVKLEAKPKPEIINRVELPLTRDGKLETAGALTETPSSKISQSLSRYNQAKKTGNKLQAETIQKGMHKDARLLTEAQKLDAIEAISGIKLTSDELFALTEFSTKNKFKLLEEFGLSREQSAELIRTGLISNLPEEIVTTPVAVASQKIIPLQNVTVEPIVPAPPIKLALKPTPAIIKNDTFPLTANGAIDATEALGTPSQRITQSLARYNQAKNKGNKLQAATIQQGMLRDAQQITNTQRIEIAEAITGKKFKASEIQALNEAHKVGTRQGNGYFTYTEAQLREKVDLLKKAGITDPKQRSDLIRSGLFGSPATVAIENTASLPAIFEIGKSYQVNTMGQRSLATVSKINPETGAIHLKIIDPKTGASKEIITTKDEAAQFKPKELISATKANETAAPTDSHAGVIALTESDKKALRKAETRERRLAAVTTSREVRSQITQGPNVETLTNVDQEIENALKNYETNGPIDKDLKKHPYFNKALPYPEGFKDEHFTYKKGFTTYFPAKFIGQEVDSAGVTLFKFKVKDPASPTAYSEHALTQAEVDDLVKTGVIKNDDDALVKSRSHFDSNPGH